MIHNRTSIINTALMRIGAQGVTAGFQDSASAQTANAAYDRVVAHCLGLHPWSFALRRKVLAQGADVADGLYRHAYPLPADCLRVVDVRSGGERMADWTILGRELLCDAAAVLLTFVSAEATAFPDAVADVIAWRLAFEMAPYAEQGGSNAQAYLEMFERALDRARTLNDLELRPARVRTSPFLEERRVN